LRTTFKTSGYDYVFEVISENEIVFYLENGLGYGSEDDLLTDAFGHPKSSTRTVNAIKNPIAVFREVQRIVIDYVLKNRVSYFCFRAKSDRIEIYSKFADSLKRFGYGYSFHEGQFTFYREV
jgi:hypothetical protein